MTIGTETVEHTDELRWSGPGARGPRIRVSEIFRFLKHLFVPPKGHRVVPTRSGVVLIKGYRPQFYFRTTDVTGAVELPEGVEMVMPGDNIQMVVNLIAPIAMEEGLRFAVREGGRTVGAGVVAKIIE